MSMSNTKINERWCLDGSGYEPGAYELVRKHLELVEATLCTLADSYAEERIADGPIVVTCADVKKAIQEYEV